MLQRLLIWIMLFALPLQGFAAVGMIHCEPSQHAQANAAVEDHAYGHRHADHLAADVGWMESGSHAHHHDHANASPDAADSADDHHSSGSDSSHHVHKTACCAGALALTTSTSALFPPAGSLVVGLYDVGVLPTVFLEGPRRPPRSLLA